MILGTFVSCYNLQAAFEKCAIASGHLRGVKSIGIKMFSVPFGSWIAKVCWNVVHQATSSKLQGRRWKRLQISWNRMRPWQAKLVAKAEHKCLQPATVVTPGKLVPNHADTYK